MTKQELIQLRDALGRFPLWEATNAEQVKAALRFAINRIEDLESDLREVKTLAKAIQRIGKD